MPKIKSLALKSTLLIFAMTLLTFSVSAETSKVGYVDVQKALRSIPAGKRVKAKLEKEVKASQKLLDRKQRALKKMKEDLEKQAGLMPDSVKRQKFKEYQQRMLELQDIYVKHQTQLKKKEAKLLRPVLSKLEKVIHAVAKEQGFTMILEVNESRVLYADPSLEITDTVIKRYAK